LASPWHAGDRRRQDGLQQVAADPAHPFVYRADRVRLAQKRLGKAAGKGTVHKNQAARRTSRLMKRAAKTS